MVFLVDVDVNISWWFFPALGVVVVVGEGRVGRGMPEGL